MSSSCALTPDAADAAHARGAARLRWARSGIALEEVEETGSTHADLLERVRDAAPSQALVRVARGQTAGRGRHGRSWIGAPGRSLLFSIALPWQCAVAESAAVTLAAALGVATWFAEAGVAVRIKWPNDLLLDEAKLGGMLAELATDRQGRTSLVLSLGLNLVLTPEEKAALDQSAADLAQRVGAARALSWREDLLAGLAGAMLEAARAFETQGFAARRAEFDALLALRGRAVVLGAGTAGERHGIVRGVDARGQLLLEDAQGLHAIAAGELRLRGAAPGAGAAD